MGVTASLLTKLQGCLLGQCLGDAFGYPIEGQGHSSCSQYMNQYVRFWFDGEKPPVEWTGQYTDDSQLARELLASLVEQKQFDANDYAQRMVRLFESEMIVGRGIACDQAVARLIHGADWEHAGCPASSAGNGTAMRAAPVGMIYYDNLESMLEVAHLQGYITHHDPRCSAGSVAIAGAVAQAIQADTIDVDTFVGNIATWASAFHPEFSEYILQLPNFIALKPEIAVNQIKHLGKQPNYVESWPGISPFVISSVIWSLYSFLRNPENYFDAIECAISVGGDVDTTGAMTGAISGAYLGVDTLPKHLLERLHDQDSWRYDDLMNLAEKAYEVHCNKTLV